MPFADDDLRFTIADLLCESGSLVINTLDIAGALEIITTGLVYNAAKDTGDAALILEANANLHEELWLFKKNFLCRGKPHWLEK
jgi:hypothetical protein